LIDGGSARQLHRKDFLNERVDKSELRSYAFLSDGQGAVPDDEDPEQNM
jgi:hypothetical protein